jgi:uncharacterized protein (DUF58 family)
MSVSGVLGWLNIRGADIHVELPDEVYCGLETLVTVRLVNSRPFLPFFLLKVNVLGGVAAFDLVASGSEQKQSFTSSFEERGEVTLAGGTISSPFPINFFVRSRLAPLSCRFTVFPAPLASSLPVGDDRQNGQGALTAATKGFDGDLAKITDYSGADPLRLVHWRLTARHGELKVKEFSASAQTPVMLDVLTLPGKNIEEILSRAVYLVNRLMRSNRPVGLKLGERQVAPACSRTHRLRILSELARYGKS